ncbi:hypothetical protein CEP52_016955 [Fusarium oligoseptatum]|uniref:Uncharacterized protein n=1 Tax=Fusarium oligoseptatum TaxID=2604345 RepID=A0A428RY55_9HYPO|nr:hypothetical protein CEP52_016955 [Fusarium oligoseptatum]
MARVQIPLDLLDSSVTCIYMENLISYWVDQGLTTEHSKVLASLLSLPMNDDALFVKCLEKEERDFRTIRNKMMRSMDIWEEVPAWDEVWRLKLAFDRNRKTDWHRNVKLYAIIVCKILPEMIMERNEHEDVWRTTRDAIGEPIIFSDTPDWYREKFRQYQARQAERDRSRQCDQEVILRYKALTRGAFDPKASDFAQQLQLPITESYLKWLLNEPRDYPIEWRQGLKEGGFTTAGACRPSIYKGAVIWKPIKHNGIWRRITFHLLGFQDIVIYKGAAIWKSIIGVWRRIIVRLDFQGIVIYKGAASYSSGNLGVKVSDSTESEGS